MKVESSFGAGHFMEFNLPTNILEPGHIFAGLSFIGSVSDIELVKEPYQRMVWDLYFMEQVERLTIDNRGQITLWVFDENKWTTSMKKEALAIINDCPVVTEKPTLTTRTIRVTVIVVD